MKSFLLSAYFKQHSCMYLVFSDWLIISISCARLSNSSFVKDKQCRQLNNASLILNSEQILSFMFNCYCILVGKYYYCTYSKKIWLCTYTWDLFENIDRLLRWPVQ